jgi:hypothetical protein
MMGGHVCLLRFAHAAENLACLGRNRLIVLVSTLVE